MSGFELVPRDKRHNLKEIAIPNSSVADLSTIATSPTTNGSIEHRETTALSFFDVKNRGAITLYDLSQRMYMLGQRNVSEEELQEFFNEIDIDKKGFINIDDYKVALEKEKTKSHSLKYESLWSDFTDVKALRSYVKSKILQKEIVAKGNKPIEVEAILFILRVLGWIFLPLIVIFNYSHYRTRLPNFWALLFLCILVLYLYSQPIIFVVFIDKYYESIFLFEIYSPFILFFVFSLSMAQEENKKKKRG